MVLGILHIPTLYLIRLYQDDEIKELKDKMDGMAEEFGEMLRVNIFEFFSTLLILLDR